MFRNNKRKRSRNEGLYRKEAFSRRGAAKIDKALEAFMTYQQEADRRFLEAEEAREKREEEGAEKRRKEEQDFFI